MNVTLLQPDLIKSAVQDVLPDGVDVATGPASAPLSLLYPQEVSSIAKATDKRRAEFAAGRSVARAAMRALGTEDRPIPMQANRAPLWPDGICGSIAHDNAVAVAVVGRTHELATLGIDIEPDEPLPHDIVDEVLTADETAAMALLPARQQGHYAKAVFCAKEAVFKCQFALSETMLGFEAMEITFDEGGRFSSVLTHADAPFAKSYNFNGHIVVAAGHIVAVTWIGVGLGTGLVAGLGAGSPDPATG